MTSTHDWEYRIKWHRKVPDVAFDDEKPFEVLYDIFCLDCYDLFQIHDEIYELFRLALDDENVYEIKFQHRIFVYEMIRDITTAAYLIAKNHFSTKDKKHGKRAKANNRKNRRNRRS